MLDEAEYAEIDLLLAEGIRATQAFRRKHGLPLEKMDVKVRFQPALDAYEGLTGHKEVNHLALYHHRLALYGEPCQVCGKPLRTPTAKMCVACGARK